MIPHSYLEAWKCNVFLKVKTCQAVTPLNYEIDHPNLIVSNWMEETLSKERFNFFRPMEFSIKFDTVMKG